MVLATFKYRNYLTLRKTGIVQKLEVVERDIFKAADEKVHFGVAESALTGDIAQSSTPGSTPLWLKPP